MKHSIALLALTCSIALFPVVASANTIIAHVDGMVCAFCVKGLEDKLKEDPAIDTVSVSLEKSEVVITAKPGQTVTEDTVRKAVFYMDYDLRDIKSVD